jgi:hypothetical protein
MKSLYQSFVLGILVVGTVSCGQNSPTSNQTRSLERSTLLDVAVFYDSTKELTKPDGLWGEGEPILAGQRIEVTTFDPKSLEQLTETEMFNTVEGKPLQVNVLPGLQRVRIIPMIPDDSSFEWQSTGVQTWFVETGKNPFARVALPMFCMKNGEIIDGAGAVLRCHGEKFNYDKLPPLPEFRLETQVNLRGTSYFEINQLYAAECSTGKYARPFDVVVIPLVQGLTGNVVVQIVPPIDLATRRVVSEISFNPSQLSIPIANQPTRDSALLETDHAKPQFTFVYLKGTLGRTEVQLSVPLDVTTALPGKPGAC